MDTKRAIEVISAARSLQGVRLQRGILRRQQMAEDLAAGRPLGDTPRTRWLFETASAILDTVAEKAKEFNDSNTDDLISVQDIGDALTNALNRLEHYTGK